MKTNKWLERISYFGIGFVTVLSVLNQYEDHGTGGAIIQLLTCLAALFLGMATLYYVLKIK